MSLAGANESLFRGFNPGEIPARIGCVALRPQQKRNAAPARPAWGLPHGEIVVASAYDHLWIAGSQRRFDAACQQHIEPSHAAAVRLEHFIGKADFIAIDVPLPQARISFRQKNYVEIDLVASGQRVEHGNPVGRNDLGQDDEAPLHARLSWKISRSRWAW